MEQTNIVGFMEKQSILSIKIFKTIAEIDEYYSTVVSPDKYFDKYTTYEVTKSQMQSAMRTNIAVAKMDYNLCFNSCTTMVQAALNSAFNTYGSYGIIPNLSFYKELFIIQIKLNANDK